MAESLKLRFRGETIGLIHERSGWGTSCGANTITKTNVSTLGNPNLGETKVNPIGTKVRTTGGIQVGINDASSTDFIETVQYMLDLDARVLGKKGVLEFIGETSGDVAVISNEAVCTSFSWNGAQDTAQKIYATLNFTGSPSGGGNTMRFFEPLLNGGFESWDSVQSKPTGWTLSANAARQQLFGTEIIGSGTSCIKLSHTGGADPYITQTCLTTHPDFLEDYWYIQLSCDAAFETQDNTPAETTVNLKIEAVGTNSAEVATRDFTLYSNRAERLSLSGYINNQSTFGDQGQVNCRVTITLDGANGDVVYIDNVRLEEIHNNDLY